MRGRERVLLVLALLVCVLSVLAERRGASEFVEGEFIVQLEGRCSKEDFSRHVQLVGVGGGGREEGRGGREGGRRVLSVARYFSVLHAALVSVVSGSNFRPAAAASERDLVKKLLLQRQGRHCVSHVSRNMKVFLPTSVLRGSSSSLESVPWGLDRIDQRSLPLNGLFTPGGMEGPLTGAGVDVFLLDTGLDANHVEFESAVGSGRTVRNLFDGFAPHEDAKLNPPNDTDGK